MIVCCKKMFMYDDFYNRAGKEKGNPININGKYFPFEDRSMLFLW
jgi:hypothetical protein